MMKITFFVASLLLLGNSALHASEPTSLNPIATCNNTNHTCVFQHLQPYLPAKSRGKPAIFYCKITDPNKVQYVIFQNHCSLVTGFAQPFSPMARFSLFHPELKSSDHANGNYNDENGLHPLSDFTKYYFEAYADNQPEYSNKTCPDPDPIHHRGPSRVYGYPDGVECFSGTGGLQAPPATWQPH